MTLDLAKLKEAAEKATPGPWAWFGTHKNPYLATEHSGRLYVMAFARSGMGGAQPVFRDTEGRNQPLKKGEELAVFAVNRQATSPDDPSVYRKDIVGFRSADASWIALANPATILALIERLESAEGALDRINHECIILHPDRSAQTVSDVQSISRAHLGKHNKPKAIPVLKPFIKPDSFTTEELEEAIKKVRGDAKP